MLAIFLLIFLSTQALTQTSQQLNPATEQTATTATPAARKSVKLLTDLQKKLLAAAGKNKTPQHRITTFTQLKQLIIEQYKQKSSDTATLEILETYLEVLIKEKTHNLATATPEVINHTNTALRALKKLRLTHQEKHQDVQKMWHIIVKIKQEFLPKKPLTARFQFGLREAGYSTAAILTALSARAALNSRRGSTPWNGNKILHRETRTHDGYHIELMQLKCPTQGSLGCTQHTNSNLFQILRKLDEQPLSTAASTKDKITFFTRTNFFFKTESEIRAEIARINRENGVTIVYGANLSWHCYPDHLCMKYLNHSCNWCKDRFVQLETDIFYTGNIESRDIANILPTLKYLSSRLGKGEKLIEILSDLGTLIAKLKKINLETTTDRYELLIFLKDLYGKHQHPPASCKRTAEGNHLLNAIRAFHQNKPLILGVSTETTTKLSHMTTNIFFKNATGDGGCIINFDSLFEPSSGYAKKIHTELKQILSFFYTYQHVAAELDTHKKEIEALLKTWYD